MKYVSKFVASERIYLDFTKLLLKSNILLCIGMAVIMFVLAVVGLLMGSMTFACIDICLGLFFLSIVVRLPRKAARRYLQMVNNLHMGMDPETQVVFGEEITLHEGAEELSVPYEQIEAMVRLANCTVLRYNDRKKAIVFDEQNLFELVDGNEQPADPAAFEAFLLERCSQVSGFTKK